MRVNSRFGKRMGIITIALCVWLLSVAFVSAQEETVHVVQQGDNLYRISLRYGIDMDALAQANGLANITRLSIGQELIIPGIETVDSGDTVENPLVAAAPIHHTVQRGETLENIAIQYGITIQQILDANNIANANRILPGDELQIWSSEVSEVADTNDLEAAPADITETITHTVQRGEYLYQIARSYDVPWTTVAEINGIFDPNRITPGMELLIPKSSASNDSDFVAAEASAEAAVTESATHVVQAGQHLAQIGQLYGVAWTSIAEANGISDPNTVYAGMELIIPGATESLNFGIIENAVSTNHPGAHVGIGRELVVRLTTQTAYAYEDGVLVKSSIISSGLPATPTVQGDFKIYLKYEAQTMSGPGYYLPNVPYVMYFYSGYGFHGTYWHSNFGNPMSHGCVNMTNSDAQWFWEFAPIGTPVHVTL